MILNIKFLATFFSSMLLLNALGCTGGGSAEYEFPEATQEVSKVQLFRDTLKPYAENGRLDSGAELLVEQAGQLSDEGVSNVSDIQAKLAELLKAKSPASVKKLAAETLDMLPESATAPATE